MHPSEPFPHFVDDFLAYLHEAQPSLASLDGVHLHDDLLEDMSRTGLDTHARALAGFGRRLHQIEPAHVTATELVEHQILTAQIEARLYEIEDLRTWERSPQLYSELLGSSLAGQALFAHAPEADRARRVLSKLRQVPRMTQAARDNVKDAPGIFVKVGLESWRSVLRFVSADLPRALSTLDDLHLLGDLADASTEAELAIRAYIAYLETDVAPKAKASFRLGRERFERKLKLEEGVGLGADRLLTIALRELGDVQEEFRKAAFKLGNGDPIEAWRKSKDEHPGPGRLVTAAKEQLLELERFLRRHNLVSMLDGEPVAVRQSPEVYRRASASMWTPGPFESKPGLACYYLTDVDPTWPAERQQEHLRDFNLSTLWSVSMHEVYPGRHVCAQHLRRVPSKVRKSTLFAAASFLGGWAHYGEHMMVEAGFGKRDPRIKVGQLGEALLRLARVVVAIRLHCEDLSVEQGMRFFRDEAFLEEATARREAERGTFDPTYLACAVGKLMMLKLRGDYQAQQGDAFSLRTFHDAVLSQGAAPFWAQRRLLLGDPAAAALE